jgi:cytochrome c biogenesis protein CcmG, thiol:disulfide interchange protein DsbE
MRRRLVAAAVFLLMLTGCTDSGLMQSGSDDGDDGAGQVPTVSAEQLAARKQAAGIADCPDTDAAASSFAGGLPDVELACLGGGQPVRLAGLRGRPMMINVWAQWCGPCRQEAPYLAEVAAETKSSKMLIMGIDFDDPRPDLALEFAELSNWKYPQMQDTDVTLREELQISGPPQTFFVTASGQITYRHAAPFTSSKQIRDLAKDHLGVDL